jgi:riboflavin transporter FmnP
MKMKNFLLAGIAGGITDFLLGWVLYGILFMDYFGGAEPMSMQFIGFGCLTFGFLIAYIYVRWANLVTFITGLKAGAGIGLFMGLMRNFFDLSMKTGAVDWQKFAVDVVISVVMGAIVGGVVAVVNGALSKPSE